MATLYKILILCVGFALSCNLRAQSHLDPVNDSREFAERYSKSLLTHERKYNPQNETFKIRKVYTR